MRRILFYIPVLLMLLSFSSCEKENVSGFSTMVQQNRIPYQGGKATFKILSDSPWYIYQDIDYPFEGFYEFSQLSGEGDAEVTVDVLLENKKLSSEKHSFLVLSADKATPLIFWQDPAPLIFDFTPPSLENIDSAGATFTFEVTSNTRSWQVWFEYDDKEDPWSNDWLYYDYSTWYDYITVKAYPTNSSDTEIRTGTLKITVYYDSKKVEYNIPVSQLPYGS